MRNSNDLLFPGGANLSGNVTSETFNVENIILWSAQLVWNGTPTGTAKLQFSNDIGDITVGNVNGTGVVNWTDVPAQTNGPNIVTASLSASPGSAPLKLDNVPYRFLRIVYSSVSGAGTGSGRFNAKGI